MADTPTLRRVVTEVLDRHPAGASLSDIYVAVERARPGTSRDSIRGTLNHGVAVGHFVRLAPRRYGSHQK